MKRCVIVGGADINNYEYIKSCLHNDDFIVLCDSGLKHLESLQVKPGLIVGDFDSHDNPHLDVETIVLPCEKDDTDTVFAVKEAIKRGFDDFLLIGVVGARLDHTLGNVSILLYLDSLGKKGKIIDDYSEMEIVSKEPAYIEDSYAYFSLLNITGTAKGITIENAKYPLENGEITCEYQYGISNEVLSGRTTKVFVREGNLLLIKVCGEERNSYSKTDHDATFMRMKRDYMGNDQLLPGYNIQLGLCDEYIAVYDVKQYASDMDCFQPLIERFYNIYGEYPEYPVADAGYGSFNNYLYCEEHGMKKYMKFTMFKKECEDKKYNKNPYRAVNFNINESGNLICPNNKEFHYLYSSPIKGNEYGRTEEYYQCEDCSGCPHKEQCCKSTGNRIVRINKELTKMHQEVLKNLNSTHGALLRMNRSIQAEGAYGTIKWNKAYTRARRRGLKGMNFEIAVISCGFNLHKYYLKQLSRRLAA